MCESRNKRVPPRVSIQGSIITAVDPSICQTSTCNIKALDVQMLTDTPPLQLNVSNDMKSSTTVTRCCITLHLNSQGDLLVIENSEPPQGARVLTDEQSRLTPTDANG